MIIGSDFLYLLFSGVFRGAILELLPRSGWFCMFSRAPDCPECWGFRPLGGDVVASDG
jgi:hypothetical protein